MSDIDTYETQIAILNQVAEEMHKKGATQLIQLIQPIHLTAVLQNPQMTSIVHH